MNLRYFKRSLFSERDQISCCISTQHREQKYMHIIYENNGTQRVCIRSYAFVNVSSRFIYHILHHQKWHGHKKKSQISYTLLTQSTIYCNASAESHIGASINKRDTQTAKGPITITNESTHAKHTNKASALFSALCLNSCSRLCGA